MDQPVISIIVPVYNVESYLRQCLDSILMQDFNDYELLLIDDGSPDNCGNICDGYASKDPRIRVIHQENGGLSAARNTGLDNSASEYIAMVDSDDILLSTRYLSTLLDVCNDTDRWHKVQWKAQLIGSNYVQYLTGKTLSQNALRKCKIPHRKAL